MGQPSLLDSARRTEIITRIDALTPSAPRRWGRMNVHQMICHLSDGYRTAFSERDVPYQGKLYQRTFMKFFALRTSAPWPKGRIKTTPQSDQELGGTRPVEFTRDLAELKRLVALFGSDPQELNGRVHPFFGPMPSADWAVWGYKHADHHLRQFSS